MTLFIDYLHKYVLPNDGVVDFEMSFDNAIGSNSSSENVSRGWNVFLITNSVHIFKQAETEYRK